MACKSFRVRVRVRVTVRVRVRDDVIKLLLEQFRLCPAPQSGHATYELMLRVTNTVAVLVLWCD